MSEYTIDPQGIVKCNECGSNNVLINDIVIPGTTKSVAPEAKIYQCIDCAKKKYDVAGAIIFKRVVKGQTVRGEVLLNHAQYDLLMDFKPTSNGDIIGMAVTNQVFPPQMFAKK